MRKVLLGLITINFALLLNSNTSTKYTKQPPSPESVDKTVCLATQPVVTYIPKVDTLEILLDALIQVESRGDSLTIGDNGKAVGILQIHPITVRDVNRILEKRGDTIRYTYEDRNSQSKSIEMFYIWKSYYHVESDFETIARCWNGGPRGMNKPSTEYYWSKVETEINDINS